MKKFGKDYFVILALTLAAGMPAVPAQASYEQNSDLRDSRLRYTMDQAHTLRLHYDVYAGGFKALNASLTMDLGKQSYDMKLQAQTQGFIGGLFPWKASYNTAGHADDGRLVPSTYTERSSWRHDEKVTTMDYGPNGKFLKSTTKDGLKITTQQQASDVLSGNAVDLLTGTLVMMQSARNTHQCAGSFPVFDGKRRYNITLKDDGTETLARSDAALFEGQVLRCTLEVEPVAGFSPKDQKRGWMAVQHHTEARHKLPTIWLARLKDSGQVVPVKMEIASAYGAVVAHLSDGTDK
jgi:hypothetical protein